jgi:hypothetical protein
MVYFGSIDFRLLTNRQDAEKNEPCISLCLMILSGNDHFGSKSSHK